MRKRGNPLIAASAAVLAVAAATVAPGGAHAAPLADVDVVAMGGTFGAFSPPLLGVGPSNGAYVVNGNCALIVAGTQVPTFFDVPPDEGGLNGTCSSVSGSGSFTSLSCGTGITTGHMTINEPAGDGAVLTYTMVFVAGVGVVEGTWTDDGGSGPAAGVALILPTAVTNCLGVITQYNFTALIAAEY
jgi:hypothetical protein